jgi:hypothetical protein
VKHLLSAALFTCALVTAGCTSGDRSPNLDDLRNADAPYYYVGSSFDGLEVTHIQTYRAGEADILYGTCKPPSGDGGCPLPLELQHRLCHGVVTVSIFVGQGAKRGSANRAAKSLRPLSKGARVRRERPDIVLDRGVPC